MLYTEFKAGEKEYKLRLRTRDIITLEKQIGGNPLSIFGNGDKLPTVNIMVAILHSSMQAYQHNITLTDAFDIFDEWVADGNSITDFLPVIVEVYKSSGLLPKDKDGEEEKN